MSPGRYRSRSTALLMAHDLRAVARCALVAAATLLCVSIGAGTRGAAEAMSTVPSDGRDGPNVRAVPPRIAAAANLSGVLDEIADRFAREQGTPVQLVFGASGVLTRQIQDGAPFELFLSADEEFPDRLVAAGLTKDRGVVYAIGRLALFAPRGSPLAVDPELEGLKKLVRAGGVSRLAIANPAVAPYGRAAEAALRKRGLWDSLAPSLVMGVTVAQAAQFATTGNAVGGLVAYSLALSPALRDRGTAVPIPAEDHPPLRQRMVLLRNAGQVSTAFYAYLQTDAAREVLTRHGYDVPSSP